MKNYRKAPWYPNAVAGSIAVIVLVLLLRWGAFWKSVGTFVGYFSPVILGAVIAYIVNPLAMLYERLFRPIRHMKTRRFLSNLLAFITVILLLVFLLLMLIPQLVESVTLFAGNLDGYLASLHGLLDKWGVSATALNIDRFIASSEAILTAVSDYIRNNLSSILTTSVGLGKGAVQFCIAFLLSIYLLSDKPRLKRGGQRLLKALVSKERYGDISDFLSRCHGILNRYIVFNLLDSLIVGISNAVFMGILGMPYVGLVSFVAAITNLIPTFGPVVGAVIGAFVLVLVNPWHALAFLIFTLILQGLDGYVIKPKLFGDSLGVSGLWILVGVIVGGRMFGILGILLAIPAVAILDLLYQDYLLPALEKRRLKATASDKQE